MTDQYQRIKSILLYLFGEDIGKQTYERVVSLIKEFPDHSEKDKNIKSDYFNENDVILISYGDSLQNKKEPPLQILFNFHQTYLKNFINTIHILPFYPYSSDDGFSVIDYLQVNPELGDWNDIVKFSSENVSLMFDGVINHISSKSQWFGKYLDGDTKYENYFIEVDPNTDLSLVTRPRTSPLLTMYQTKNGKKFVWTTFSADQIDLNYRNPDTLIDILDVIFHYIKYGAKIIRLDAIAYLWKEIGTNCIHLPQTHAVIQLFRAILDVISPNVLLITETNVPHKDNVSYFGDGINEAHMVYQFSLPPLVAHALLTGSAEYLTDWASTLKTPSSSTAFFNFTASHDGIGLLPLIGILPQDEIDLLVEKTFLHGGKVSSRTNVKGNSSPYELNITYFDLLNNNQNDETQLIKINRFIVSQAIPLALAGIPGIYIHSLLGSNNDYAGVQKTGLARSINRQKLDFNEVNLLLSNPQSLTHQIFSKYKKIVEIRISEKAFHPNAKQEIINFSKPIFSVKRTSVDEEEIILAIFNVSNQNQMIFIKNEIFGNNQIYELQNLLTFEKFIMDTTLKLNVAPYEIVWLKVIC